MAPISGTNAPAALSQEELQAEFRLLLHEKMRTAIWLTPEDEIGSDV